MKDLAGKGRGGGRRAQGLAEPQGFGVGHQPVAPQFAL